MAMRQVIFRAETRHQNVRPEFPDHPYDVCQNFVPLPNPQGFIRTLGETEVDRTGEELPGMILLPRGEEFLGPDYSKFFPEFRPNQVLSTIAASHRQIPGVVKRTVRP